MPDLDLAAQKPSIVYGNQLIEEDFPSDIPYTGAWVISFKKFPTAVHYSITPTVNQEESDILISDWSKNEDPLTQADLLDNEEDQVQELIFRVRRSTSIPYRKRLANRLLTLFNDAKEEDPDSIGIVPGSLRNFYTFLHLYTKLKYPVISLTPDNNIYASWRGEQNQLFSVHFFSNRDVRYVIFKPNDRHPERQIRTSGSATADILMENIASYGVWDWISNGR